MQDFWSALSQDFARNGQKLTRRRLARAFMVPDRFGALAWIRLYQLLERRGRSTVLAYRTLLHAHGVEMAPKVSIGAGLFLPHPRGVLFAEGTRLGERCSVYGEVRFLGVESGTPVVGDDVFLGDGARLVGHVHVGHGARVGAGAVVTHDVPADATVAGVPARVISQAPRLAQSRAGLHTRRA